MSLDFDKNEDYSSSKIRAADFDLKNVDIIEIDDEFSIYLASKKAREAGVELGLNEIQLEEVEIALRELITNVLKHGGGNGVLRIYKSLKSPGTLMLEVVDWGEGIENLHRALEDGFSTGAGIGGGLPAVNRLMNSFEYISQSRRGAKLRISKRANNISSMESSPWRFSVYSRPVPGEIENGDGFFLRNSDDMTVAAVVDGLGHGVEAHKATSIALKVIEDYYRWPEKELIEQLHEKLFGSRGVALGLLKIQRGDDTVRYTGIGNIFGHLFGSNIITFVNYNGTLGIKLRKFKTFEYPFKRGDVIVMHSDGISCKWIDEFSQLWSGDLQGFSHYIIKSYGRPNDDASIIVGGQL